MSLLVTLHRLQQVWVIDPESLQVKRRIAVPAVFRAVSTPALSVAFAGGPNIQGRKGVLLVLDLKKGEVVRSYSDGWEGELYNPVMAPDSRYLFAESSWDRMSRFKVNGAELVCEQSSPRIGDNPRGIDVSPDSRHVCLPSGGGNFKNVPNHPDPGPYGLYVYDVGELMRPAFVLRDGAFRTTIGFDPRGGHIYGCDGASHQLIVFDPNGVKQAEYELSRPGDDTFHFLVHPTGSRLLVHTEKKLFYAELSGR